MGSTEGIAAAIGEELRRHGLEVDVANVVDVTSLQDYGGIILGSAVYAARWRPEAVRFVKRHGGDLNRKPVWLFESGWVGKRPATITPTPRARRTAQRIERSPCHEGSLSVVQ
jgi:menaquinone-dependent protoporphyrinogen oxidase